jgi:hypothetical protein
MEDSKLIPTPRVRVSSSAAAVVSRIAPSTRSGGPGEAGAMGNSKRPNRKSRKKKVVTQKSTGAASGKAAGAHGGLKGAQASRRRVEDAAKKHIIGKKRGTVAAVVQVVSYGANQTYDRHDVIRVCRAVERGEVKASQMRELHRNGQWLPRWKVAPGTVYHWLQAAQPRDKDASPMPPGATPLCLFAPERAPRWHGLLHLEGPELPTAGKKVLLGTIFEAVKRRSRTSRQRTTATSRSAACT